MAQERTLSGFREATYLSALSGGEFGGDREGEVAEHLHVLVLERREALEVFVADVVAGGSEVCDRVVEYWAFQSTSALSGKPSAPSWSSAQRLPLDVRQHRDRPTSKNLERSAPLPPPRGRRACFPRFEGRYSGRQNARH